MNTTLATTATAVPAETITVRAAIVHLAFLQPGERPGHEVIEFEAHPGLTPEALAELAFHVTNCGQDGLFRRVYRSGFCATLSVGDLVAVNGHAFRCEGCGWALLGKSDAGSSETALNIAVCAVTRELLA